MKLFSCNWCGVVLDADWVRFPDPFDDEGNVDHTKAEQIGSRWYPKTCCPVCQGELVHPVEDEEEG